MSYGTNEAAMGALALSNRNASVKKTATCNKCGSTSVAWVTSKKTGKNYLCQTTGAMGLAPGTAIPVPSNPHFKWCGQACGM